MLARQVLYLLIHTSSHFCFTYFSDRVFVPTSDHDPPACTSFVAEITGMCQHTGQNFNSYTYLSKRPTLLSIAREYMT
jgi:hypothetical protein